MRSHEASNPSIFEENNFEAEGGPEERGPRNISFEESKFRFFKVFSLRKNKRSIIQ